MLINVIKSTRPSQWTKSLFVFFPFLFSVNEAWSWDEYEKVFSIFSDLIVALVAFTLASSSIYLLNDVLDRDKDRLHPQKKVRPIASGVLGRKVALASFVTIGTLALILSSIVNLSFFITLLSYLILMLGYGFLFRNIFLVDVIAISIGFVMRVFGGAVSIDVPVSDWLYVCMAFGALFIAFSKRLAEGSKHGYQKYASRKTLRLYNPKLLKMTLITVLFCTILSYCLYTYNAPNLPSNNTMMLTVPFVVFGMGRYVYLVLNRGRGEKPEEIIVKDLPLIGSVLFWIVSVIVILNLYR